MSLKIASVAMMAMTVLASPAMAQDEVDKPDHAVGTDVSYSTDADETDVLRIAIHLDWHYRSPEDYKGFRLERV